jgi:SAM-dependent methyltransferase
MYRDLASFYDNVVRDRFSEVVGRKVVSALAALGQPPPGRLIDLGCGTGRSTVLLVRAGYTVTGLDRAERMLDIARRRAEKEEVPVDLRVGDLTSFAFEDRFDAAVATGDVVNHLLDEHELARFFGCVRDSTFPGSAFVFDVNTEVMYRSQLWNTVDSVVETEAFKMTTSARFDAASGMGRLDMRVLERTMMTEYDRRGSLRQRWWSEDLLRSLLEDAAFQVVGVDPFHPIDASDELPMLDGAKALWSCRRR